MFGVFGGSFDPPHVAHTLLASYALAAFELERILIVPTFSHALGKRSTSYEDRLRMCELAFCDVKRCEISDVESHLPAPSLMLNTLQALQQTCPGVQLRLLIGTDILAEKQHWHDFAGIERLAPPIVIERQGTATHDADQPALPNVSSSDIRRRVQAGMSTRGRLSPSVERYIHAQGLYRTT